MLAINWAHGAAAQPSQPEAPANESALDASVAPPSAAESEPEPVVPDEPEPTLVVDEPAAGPERQLGAGMATPASAPEAELVVTGSRIRRSSFAQPSSVLVVDRKAIERSGARTALDLIRNLDINSGSDLNSDVAGVTSGTASFNLRGLGVDSTLVLLNGRRMVQSGLASSDGTNFVDVNTIPVVAIERIEILKGGASALYGSDAVAGVVNIITRKNYDGVELQVGGQTTDSYDQHEWDVSLVAGAHTDRTRMLGVISFFDRDPLHAESRDFTKNGSNTSALGWPSTFLALRPPPPMGPGPFPFRDPGCGNPAFPHSSPTKDPAAALPFCVLDFNSYDNLVVAEQRVQVYGSMEHDLGEHATVYLETDYAHNRSQRPSSPSYPLLQNITIPADHLYNPTGVPLRWYGRLLGSNAPPDEGRGDVDMLHVAGGIKGDFAGVARDVPLLEEWEWEFGGTWDTNRNRISFHDVLTDQLRLALNSCKPTDDPAGCWNPFTFGAPNSRQLQNTIFGEVSSVTDTELSTLGLDLHGPVVQLPGGNLELAIGAQARNESTKFDADHDSNREAYAFVSGAQDYQGSRKILSAYTELSLPLVRGLELQAAGRVEHYEAVGTTANPMAGFSWVPATTFQGVEASAPAKLRLRGTFATSFRAPSLLQTVGKQTTLEPLFSFSNVDGMPTQGTTSTYLAVRTNGNPQLKPQTSRAFTVGAEWAPLDGLNVTTDYWNFNYTDLIVKQSAQQLLEADFRCDAVNAPGSCDPRVVRDPGGIAQSINTSLANAPSVVTHGLDFSVSYRSKLSEDIGSLSLGATGSYTLAYLIPADSVGPAVRDQLMHCKGERCDVAGYRNFANFARPLPRLRMTFPVSWTLGPHTATVVVHFISGYRDDADADPSPRTDYRSIAAFTTFDLHYEARLDEGAGYKTTFRLGLLNALDSDPPTVNAGFGYDVFTHDPRGRMFYARLTQEM